MNMREIRDIAKTHGLKSARLIKVELVHAIQQTEGNFNCFASARDGYCDQGGCLWRSDCFAAAKKLPQ